jgi:PadR family transcriptional regulator PadR
MPTQDEKADVLQGTLALMVLQTLKALGPQHGYGIARRIEQVSGDALALNQGTLYPALVRLEQQGWIKGRWGVSENNRRARFYAITARGEKQLAAETERWSRVAAIVGKFLPVPGGRS